MSSVKGGIPIVGVTYRGSRWLDAAFTCLHREGENPTTFLEKRILESRQYTQLKAVILSRENLTERGVLDLSDLSRALSLPVISLLERSAQGNRKDRGYRLYEQANQHELTTVTRDKKIRVKAVGLDENTLNQIISTSCTLDRSVPEAVKVAQLTAEAVYRLMRQV